MSSIVRSLMAILVIACHGAQAQNVVPPVVTVQGLAPQLVAFAGSGVNFQNLVNGLAQGTPVQLISTLPNGSTQIVTFTPTTPMSANDIAVTLEAARQQLITLGIGSPTAEQIGVTLMGGVVPTALGGRQVTGLLKPRNPPSPAAQLQSGNLAAAGGSVPTSTSVIPPVSAVSGAVNVQVLPPAAPTTPAATALPRNTSDSLTEPGATSRSTAVNTSASPTSPTPTVPGAAVQQQRPTVERVPAGRPPVRN
jgi:hypothetical protein